MTTNDSKRQQGRHLANAMLNGMAAKVSSTESFQQRVDVYRYACCHGLAVMIYSQSKNGDTEAFEKCIDLITNELSFLKMNEHRMNIIKPKG